MNIQATEQTLPDNVRSRMATAFLNTIRFKEAFTDFLVHEGKPILAKTARGLIPLSELGVPGPDFRVTAADLKNFVTTYCDEKHTDVSANSYWDQVIVPEFKAMRAVSRRVDLPGPDGKVHMRVSFLQHGGQAGVGMVVRVAHKPNPLDQVGLSPSVIKRLKNDPRGLLIITGATASGKTSTAYSILDYLNKNGSGHIVTIEDPIEYVLPSANCLITQRHVGSDVKSFGDGLVDTMRHSPEVILTSEIRGRDAAEAAIIGAESGALMIVTTHGRTVTGTIRKILALCDDASQAAMRTVLAGSLIAVIRQELVPHENGERYSMVHETLHGTEAVAKALRDGDWATLARICGGQTPTEDFHPMRDSVTRLRVDGKISASTAEALLRKQTV